MLVLVFVAGVWGCDGVEVRWLVDAGGCRDVGDVCLGMVHGWSRLSMSKAWLRQGWAEGWGLEG